MSSIEAGCGRAGDWGYRWQKCTLVKGSILHIVWMKLKHEQLCNCISHGDSMKPFVKNKSHILSEKHREGEIHSVMED